MEQELRTVTVLRRQARRQVGDEDRAAVTRRPSGSQPAAHAGWEALERGEWEEARALFEADLDGEETPEALEGLGTAAWWLDDGAATFDARERAYGLYREADDDRGAARVATWLAWDCVTFRGEPAVANGWIGRAHHLLEGFETVSEHGWLALREGEMALLLLNDTSAARRLGGEAAEAGRSLGLLDLEMVGLALEGLALVSEGEVAEGMRRLDESAATIVAGELNDLCAISLSSCYLLFACERMHDYDRAAQWCSAVKEFCKRWRINLLFAICRAHYATALTWQGAWEEAEAELVSAEKELAEIRPGYLVEGCVRLGELRRLQGRLEEATGLFEEFAFHPLAILGLAAIAFDRGDAVAAADLVDRHLRTLPAEDALERVAGLELAVRARLTIGDSAGANTALAELRKISAKVTTGLLRASVLSSEGLVAAFGGDHDLARRRFEDAIDLWNRNKIPFEAARTRLELARALLALARPEGAAQEARAANEVFTSLGAAGEAESAGGLQRELETMLSETMPSSHEGATSGRTDLTRRELEVLRLVAQGLSNQNIAARLVLSEHTVHRHVANILAKLGISSRTAAVAHAARYGLL